MPSPIAHAVYPWCSNRKHPNKECLSLFDSGAISCFHCSVRGFITKEPFTSLNWRFKNGGSVDQILRAVKENQTYRSPAKIREPDIAKYVDTALAVPVNSLPRLNLSEYQVQASYSAVAPTVKSNIPKCQPKPYSTDLPDSVVEYFLNRHISEETLTKMKVGGAGNVIHFNYFRNGFRINTKYRPTDKKKFWQDASAPAKIFYNLDDASFYDTVIISEGEIDQLSFIEAGVNAASLSVPDGAPSPETKNYESKFSYVDECVEELENATKIIIATDNDLPGETLKKELIRRLDPVRCYEIKWPEDRKDANDVLQKDGQVALKALADNAVPMPIQYLIHVSELAEAYDYRYDNYPSRGKSTGLRNIDDLYTVSPGELCVVVGIPSAGKSEFIDALMVSLSKEYGWKHAVFSPENMPLELHLGKLAQKYTRKPFEKCFNPRMSKEESIEARLWLAEHFVFINPPDEETTVEMILQKAKQAVQKYGVRTLLIDPWNEIDHRIEKFDSETNYIGNQLRSIKSFARAHEVSVFIIAHPTKLSKLASGLYPVPTPYDISSSAHWRNKADVAMAIWRNTEIDTKVVEVHIQKVRFRHTGKPGKALVSYDPYTGLYSPLSLEDNSVYDSSQTDLQEQQYRERSGEIDIE